MIKQRFSVALLNESRHLGSDTMLWVTSYLRTKEPHCPQYVGI